MAKGRKGRHGRSLGDAMADQRQAFIKKFGREPGPGDPIIFDPDHDTPWPMPARKLRAGMVLTMIRAGIPEHLIYAYIRTGGLVMSEEGLRRASPEDRAAWNQAMAEFKRDFGA
jgi:hypothetical protein